MCVVTFDWEENDAAEKVKHFMEKRKLAWAVVEVTNACNLNCLWCYANNGYKSGIRREHMPKERLDRLLGILSRSGIRQVTFSGGEPTLYPHLVYAVKKAKGLGLVVHMNTNGYLLTKKLAFKLKKLGLSQVQVNIDSLKWDAHDEVRGRKGSFIRAVRALKNAKAAGMTCVSQTVLTKRNENEILDIFKTARGMGIQRCRVWDMLPTGCGENANDMIPTDYIETLKKLAEFAKSTGAKRIESGDPLFPKDYDAGIDIHGGFCAAVSGGFVTISVGGDVYPCATQRVPVYNIFNAGKGDISNFHSQKLKEYYSCRSEAKGKCSACGFFEKCGGGCPTRSVKGSDYWCRSGPHNS
jgi:radical SAM protein with 4Fe4S-binding SPASM domain